MISTTAIPKLVMRTYYEIQFSTQTRVSKTNCKTKRF